MSALVIRLLGPPEIERDGSVVPPPRGHKTWAVLAYVVLAERPVTRTWLAELVFADAEDPRGALRWALAQLRRALGLAGALRGDPLEPGLPAGTTVDVLELAAGLAEPSLARGVLLEGIEPGGGRGVRCLAAGGAPTLGGRLRGRDERCGAARVGVRCPT